MQSTDPLTHLEARISRLIDFARGDYAIGAMMRSMREPISSGAKRLERSAFYAAARKNGPKYKSVLGKINATNPNANNPSMANTRKHIANQLWNGRELLASRAPLTNFSSVDRSGGYVTIRDAQGNERKFRQPGLLNAIKRNPVKSSVAGLAVATGVGHGVRKFVKSGKSIREVANDARKYAWEGISTPFGK